MKRPRILITTASSPRDHGLRRTDSVTGQNYSEAVVQAGGLPLMVANLDPTLAEAFAAEADGIVFSGGADFDPELFGQEPHPELGHVSLERDRFELALYRAAKARAIPVLGVCRGIQLINVAEGGTLHQHLPALEGTIQHSQRAITGEPAHWVALEPSSRLARALGATKLKTNSYHHQAVAALGRNLRVTGKSADGIVEALEGTGEHFVLGVQWHPEMSFQHFPEHLVPFQLVVEAAQRAATVSP
jgi:putative glutamine amidotransferase